jgi:hypothetical protein
VRIPLDTIGAGKPVKLPKPVGWVDNDTVFLYPVVDNSVGVWVADVPGGALRQLSDLLIADPDWSPAARSWVFGTQGDAGEIYALSAAGEERRVVDADGYAPLWSPDGRRIVWVEGASRSTEGWTIHVMDADGSNDRALTAKIPSMQESPPVPGPKAKRFWLDDDLLAFTRVGRDYGAAERQGMGRGVAGNDIENLWSVPLDGSSPPRRLTDFVKVFYLKDVAVSPDSDALGVVGLSYLDRTQQLWAVRTAGGAPAHVDAGVRWYMWLE